MNDLDFQIKQSLKAGDPEAGRNYGYHKYIKKYKGYVIAGKKNPTKYYIFNSIGQINDGCTSIDDCYSFIEKLLK